MLVDHDRELLSKNKMQIQTLEIKFSKYDQTTQITPFKKRLKETMEKYEKEIINGKKRKFLRDTMGYDNESAYKWKHTGNQRGNNFTNKSVPKGTTSQGDSTLSDFSSLQRHGEGDEVNPRKR